HLDDIADILPLHILRFLPERPLTALLDQHGGDGDLGARRRAAIENGADAPFLLSLLPFLKGFTVFYWATGTWWIPMLLLLGAWRHFYRHFPLRYDPSYWGAIFPLGMYTVCTLQMAEALELKFLLFIPRYFVFAALGAWCLTFGGMLHEIITGMIRMARAKPAARRSSRSAGA
ncbi:MAG: hypothetical protein ACREFJ_06310, partial [Acetobacteraceae bacterium]